FVEPRERPAEPRRQPDTAATPPRAHEAAEAARRAADRRAVEALDTAGRHTGEDLLGPRGHPATGARERGGRRTSPRRVLRAWGPRLATGDRAGGVAGAVRQAE